MEEVEGEEEGERTWPGDLSWLTWSTTKEVPRQTLIKSGEPDIYFVKPSDQHPILLPGADGRLDPASLRLEEASDFQEEVLGVHLWDFYRETWSLAPT